MTALTSTPQHGVLPPAVQRGEGGNPECADWSVSRRIRAWSARAIGCSAKGLVEVLKPGGGEVSAGLGREFSIRPTPKAPLSTKNQGRIPVSAYP